MKEISKSDENIINTLLKGNFDGIKDESLDIDLSACVTIPSSTSNLSFCSNADEFWSLNSSDFPDNPFELEGNLPDFSFERIIFQQTGKESKSVNANTSEIHEHLNKTEAAATNDAEIEIDYECTECCRIFRNFADYKSHKREKNHSEDFLQIKCNLCERKFNNKGGFKKHFRAHGNIPKKDSLMSCPDCGKLLKLSSMWMHRKIHSDSKQYACDICGQKFVQKINLTHHVKSHTGENAYECPECKKRFPERSKLLRHQQYHSLTRPFQCPKCDKTYKTERCLKVHSLIHLEQRPYACKVCDKSFISNSKLKQHLNIHTGERPYKCNYCARDFTNFPNWLKHTRRRHQVDHKTGELLKTVPKFISKKEKKIPSKKQLEEKNIPSKKQLEKKKIPSKKQLEEKKGNSTNLQDFQLPASESDDKFNEVKLKIENDNENGTDDISCGIDSQLLLATPSSYKMESYLQYVPGTTSVGGINFFDDQELSLLNRINNSPLKIDEGNQFKLPSIETLFTAYNHH